MMLAGVDDGTYNLSTLLRSEDQRLRVRRLDFLQGGTNKQESLPDAVRMMLPPP